MKIKDTDIHHHLKARMLQRGINKEEIEITINKGWSAEDAKEGTIGKTFVFPYNNYWEGNKMKIEYDPERDLLYIYFTDTEKKSAETVTIKPGVHADFDKDGKLIGIEVIDASELMGKKIEFALPEHVAVA